MYLRTRQHNQSDVLVQHLSLQGKQRLHWIYNSTNTPSSEIQNVKHIETEFVGNPEPILIPDKVCAG